MNTIYSCGYFSEFILVEGISDFREDGENLQNESILNVNPSFRVMSPYVYYIPTAVIRNTGLACEFSIAPSERPIIYSRWENCLRERIYTPVLSDMGEASAKFCFDFELEQL